MRSPSGKIVLEEIKSGTTNVCAIYQGKLEELACPLPPLAEQKRIVAKVDELMALCDQLEQQTEDQITTHGTLVKTLLDALTSATNDAAQFQQAWQTIEANFDLLFTTESSIDHLKQAILQLAVMGKLVPQDPDDEPASELLKRIAETKEQLIAEKRIKRQKQIASNELLGNKGKLPLGWEAEGLINFTIVGTGATPSRTDSSYYEPKEFNWVTSGETSEDYISSTREKISAKAIKETNVSIYPTGTLIVAMYGQGKTRGQVAELLVEAGTNQACAAIQCIEKSKHHKRYLKLFFQKSYEEIRKEAAGGAQPNLNVGKISKTIIPIPPLKEQQRIVAKVDELMTLCDTLKANLKSAQTTQLTLTDSIVKAAVS